MFPNKRCLLGGLQTLIGKIDDNGKVDRRSALWHRYPAHALPIKPTKLAISSRAMQDNTTNNCPQNSALQIVDRFEFERTVPRNAEGSHQHKCKTQSMLPTDWLILALAAWSSSSGLPTKRYVQLRSSDCQDDHLYVPLELWVRKKCFAYSTHLLDSLSELVSIGV